MHLLPEPLFTLQTDNVYMSGITGTMQGRIFLCGRDGCVYEMDYQVKTFNMKYTYSIIIIILHALFLKTNTRLLLVLRFLLCLATSDPVQFGLLYN